MAPEKTLKLRLFFDKSLLEVFANEGELVVTQVVPPAEGNLQMEIFADGGDVTIQRLEAWTLRPPGR